MRHLFVSLFVRRATMPLYFTAIKYEVIVHLHIVWEQSAGKPASCVKSIQEGEKDAGSWGPFLMVNDDNRGSSPVYERHAL